MATGIDWDHPEVRKGMDLFEDLFRDRPVPMRRPSPTREEKEEERRKGMELFEELFADRLYPPEVPEEVPEPTPPREEVEFVEEPSPVKIPSPAKWWSYKVSPPKWLTHSMDRDLFPDQTHPDWYTRYTDPSYPMSPIKPPYPPSPGISPPFWDISEILQLEPPGDKSSIFMTPPPPPPPKEMEPPLPEFYHDPSFPVTSFDMAMHKMHWELQKYEHDKEHIVQFVKMTPLVRDTQILTQELEALVKLYLPDVNAENMGPLIAYHALNDYIEITERKLKERYGEEASYGYRYPEITEEVLAAQVRLHKQKALDAIDSYKRGYLFLKRELEKAEAQLARCELELQAEKEIESVTVNQIEKLRAEEEAVELKYEASKLKRHFQNCPFKAEAEAAFFRHNELRRLIPQMKKELERTRVAHERDVKNMSIWVTLFPPNFVDRLQSLLNARLTKRGYKPVPVELYVQLVEEMETDLQNMKESRESNFESLSYDCREYTKFLNEHMAELEEARRITNDLLEEQSILRAELNSLRLEGENRKGLWAKLREEYIYYKDYNEMLLGKIIALHADASLQSEDLPVIAGPKSRSPSPVGISPAGTNTASPPASGSETFNISHIQSSPGFGESPGLLDDQRPSSDMLNISDLSQSGGSPEYESILQGQAQSDNLDEERPPSEMLDISDLSGSGGSPAYESIPQSQAQSDNLDDERPPSEMLDFSGLQGGGSFLASPEDSASSGKKTFAIPSPGKMEQLQMDVEIIPQDIRRSPSGERVVCDVAVQMQEAALRPPRRIEKRYQVVRGTPPISQTVGRRVDRRYGMFTPRTVIRRGHVGVRRPLFAGDFESPDSPWGTGRRTHPELMDLPQHAPSPRPPRLDTTIEWENPEMNTAFRE
ncbi:hypothetical protein AVEN_100794-1 [Araneus ventricosus]|uniref:Uncharacterized protein n=1 Tax=Araneus ventricosus TaxID=182803 RepID=A0A4Y2AXI0_ARAVE|nr:hypothetical protein AVEN_100794-1 [Araneus ventricosus]